MARNLILTGGATHSFPVATPALAALLCEHGFESTISEDIESSLAGLDKDRPELLTVYALRWHVPERSTRRSAPGRQPVGSRTRRDPVISERGGLVALHTALICLTIGRAGGHSGGRLEPGRSRTRHTASGRPTR